MIFRYRKQATKYLLIDKFAIENVYSGDHSTKNIEKKVL